MSEKSEDPALIHLLVAPLLGKGLQGSRFLGHAVRLITVQACFYLGISMATAILFYFQLPVSPYNRMIDRLIPIECTWHRTFSLSWCFPAACLKSNATYFLILSPCSLLVARS